MHHIKSIANAMYTISKPILAPTAKATAAYSTAYLFNSYIYESLADTTSYYAKAWELYEYKAAVSESIYNFIHTNLSPEIADFGSHLTTNFLPSLKNAILLDGIVFFVLGSPILPGIIGATIAYDLRASINNYFENSKPYGVAGGFFAGAIKYGIAGLTLDKKVLLIGAINNAAYEYFSKEVSAIVNNNDIVGLYASFFQIEGLDAFLNIIQKYAFYQDMDADNIMQKYALNQLITTLNVAALLSGSAWVLLQKSKFSELEYNHTESILNLSSKFYNDILHAVNLQKPVSGDLENEVIDVNFTFYYNAKTQCILKDFTQLNICSLDEYYDELSQNTELNNGETQQDIKEEL
ncbi:MAG: hypothetical protein AB8B46_01970 [Candidatus Midichloriaceae bacterium]